MSNFITAKEVIDTAFSGDLDKNNIPSHLITLAEQNHVRAALGDDFFNRLDQSSPSPSFSSQETTVKTYLKDALAYYVAYEAIPYINTKASNTGLAVLQVHTTDVPSKSEKEKYRDQLKETADGFMVRVQKYLEDNIDDLTYLDLANTVWRDSNRYGGIVFKEL